MQMKDAFLKFSIRHGSASNLRKVRKQSNECAITLQMGIVARVLILINMYISFGKDQVYLINLMFNKLSAFSLGLSYFLLDQPQPQCCGIVGIVTKAPVSQVQAKQQPKKRITLEQFLCDGVDLLKNRGYDSAGIFRHGSNIKEGLLIKYADQGNSNINCIDRVVEEVLNETGVATLGLAHTRWATCGGKVSRNAHPHFDQNRRIYLVHNGIISNHAEIKSNYLGDCKFSSETDTEVIAQFLGLQIKQGKTMVEALQKFGSVADLKASQWGLVIVDREQPDKIYTYTHGSPLLLGFSPFEDQIYVVSQLIAFQTYANCYLPTNDGEIFELSVNQIGQLKQKYAKRLIKLQNQVQVLKKAPEPHKYFYNYQIRQQASIPFRPDFDRIKNTVKFGSYLSMIACGSSYYAAYASEPFFKMLKCFKKFNITDPAELDEHDITEDETVVIISQSGETKDLITIVDNLKHKQKINTIGIINVEGSTLARKVDFPIYIKVGRETCVAATKSFFHQVLNLIRFTTEVAEQKNSVPIQMIQEIREELQKVPSFVEETIANCEKKCVELAEVLKHKESIFLLGKRETMAIARQAALKIKQLNYIHAEALGASEMKHGPIALIESSQGKQKTTVIFLFILENATYPFLMNALDQVHSRNAFVVVITDCLHLIEQSFQNEKKKFFVWKQKLEADCQKDIADVDKTAEEIKKIKEKYEKQIKQRPQPSQKYDFVLEVPHLKYTSHLLSILPIQIFVEKMAEIKGINPDFPRNLAKSVTV